MRPPDDPFYGEERDQASAAAQKLLDRSTLRFLHLEDEIRAAESGEFAAQESWLRAAVVERDFLAKLGVAVQDLIEVLAVYDPPTVCSEEVASTPPAPPAPRDEFPLRPCPKPSKRREGRQLAAKAPGRPEWDNHVYVGDEFRATDSDGNNYLCRVLEFLPGVGCYSVLDLESNDTFTACKEEIICQELRPSDVRASPS